MELLDLAKTSNDFGLREKFPWSGKATEAPWTQDVTDPAEISYVKTQLFPICPIMLGKSPLIKRVENPYLWARYVLSYEELRAELNESLAERYVIHATSEASAYNIADVNFDWRCVRRARYGQGVSFSLDASYAHRYASGSDVYIIAGIAVGKTICGSYGTVIPSRNYDTTGDPRGKVYVKYYDSDFYPYYIVQ